MRQGSGTRSMPYPYPAPPHGVAFVDDAVFQSACDDDDNLFITWSEDDSDSSLRHYDVDPAIANARSDQTSTFYLADSEGIVIDWEMYLIRKRTDDLSLKSLTDEDREQFLGKGGSREKEWHSIADSGAVSVLTLKRSREIKDKHPDRIISSRTVSYTHLRAHET